jgi:hypothetical protein
MKFTIGGSKDRWLECQNEMSNWNIFEKKKKFKILQKNGSLRITGTGNVKHDYSVP